VTNPSGCSTQRIDLCVRGWVAQLFAPIPALSQKISGLVDDDRADGDVSSVRGAIRFSQREAHPSLVDGALSLFSVARV
jgi:hypothetical protein